MDGLIWAIIFVVVALVKGFTKLQKPSAEDPADDDETPPVGVPRPSRPRPQPRPPVMSSQRLPPPVSRTAAPMGPRPIVAAAGEARKIDADQIRRFVERLSGQSVPQPPVIPPPAPSAVHRPPPPKPETVPEAPDIKQTIVEAPIPTQSARASQWAQALRDRQNVRNIVIASEIIGPPRGETT